MCPLGVVRMGGNAVSRRLRCSGFLAGFLVSLVSIATPGEAISSGRVELFLGGRSPRGLHSSFNTAHAVQPAIGVEGSITPRHWPVGFTAYTLGAADWYEGQTLRYPGFGDWLSADYRVFYGAAGLGLERGWTWGRSRVSLAGGLMASTIVTRVSREDWSETGSGLRANGPWASIAASRALTDSFGIGARARYSWDHYADERYTWVKAGGLQFGLTLDFGSQAR